MKIRKRALGAICAASLMAMAGPGMARELTDMSGATVTVPDAPLRIAAYNPPLSYFIAVLAPDQLVALNQVPHKDQIPHLSDELLALPNLGSWFKDLNQEQLVALHPDAMLIEPKGSVANDAETKLISYGIEPVRVRYDRLDNIAPLFRFLGELLGEEDRGEALASYADETLAEIDALVAAIPEEERPRVYYAQGEDGLRTACAAGTQMEVTQRSGGRVAIDCQIEPGRKGQRNIALDQVIAMQPDVIFATSKKFLNTIENDPRWQAVKAVADGRVYVSPSDFGGWIDRPPLFTRLVGLRWAYAKLYMSPEEGDAVIKAAKKEYFSLFFHED